MKFYDRLSELKMLKKSKKLIEKFKEYSFEYKGFSLNDC